MVTTNSYRKKHAARSIRLQTKITDTLTFGCSSVSSLLVNKILIAISYLQLLQQNGRALKAHDASSVLLSALSCITVRSTPLTCISAIGHAFRIDERYENESLGPSASFGKARNFRERISYTLGIGLSNDYVQLSVLSKQKGWPRKSRFTDEPRFETAYRRCILYMRMRRNGNITDLLHAGAEYLHAARQPLGFRDRDKRDERRRNCQPVR